MVKKETHSKNKKMHDELKAIKQLKNVAVILSNNDLENAFLSNVAGPSEGSSESIASDVLSKISGQESGFKKLEKKEGGVSRHKVQKGKLPQRGNKKSEKISTKRESRVIKPKRLKLKKQEKR